MSRRTVISALLAGAFGASAVAAAQRDEDEPAAVAPAAPGAEVPAEPNAEAPEAAPPAPAPAPAAATPAPPAPAPAPAPAAAAAAAAPTSEEITAALVEAKAQGFTEANARMSAVLATPEGQAHPALAAFMLSSTTGDAAAIVASLKNAPAATVPGTGIHSTRALDLTGGGKPAAGAQVEGDGDKGPKAESIWGEVHGIDYSKGNDALVNSRPAEARAPINTAN